MDENTRLQIFGTQELADLFDEMSSEVQKNVVNTGFRKAAKVLIEKINDNLASVTKQANKFKKSVGTSTISGELALNVGIKKKGIGWTAHFLEGGTQERYYKTQSNSGLFRKKIKGTHFTGKEKETDFFENAVDSTENEVNNNIYQYIDETFTKLIDKYENGKKS